MSAAERSAKDDMSHEILLRDGFPDWFKICAHIREDTMPTGFSRTRGRALLALGALPAARLAGAAEDVDSKRTGGPYVPTPQIVVDEMLRMGKVGPSDFVI